MAKLQSDLSKIAGKIPAAAERALLQTAADIVDLTKQITPVDTGALKQSYGADPVSSTHIRIGSDKEYAPYVEYGTVNSPSQPHLTPAFEQNVATFKARLKEEIERIVT